MKATLTDLLEQNRQHADSLPESHFSDVQEGQHPALVSVCCSDSRVSQEGMWAIDDPGFLFTVSNIGNQVWDTHDDEVVASGDILYPLLYTDTDLAAVVGHTGCGAITATLEAVRGRADEFPCGIRERIDGLRPVVEAGLDDDRIDADRDIGLVDQLVEYNVDRQVAFLESAEELSDQTVLGFVYDFQSVYGDVPGRCYLVNIDGATALDRLHGAVPEEYHDHVKRLL